MTTKQYSVEDMSLATTKLVVVVVVVVTIVVVDIRVAGDECPGLTQGSQMGSLPSIFVQARASAVTPCFFAGCTVNAGTSTSLRVVASRSPSPPRPLNAVNTDFSTLAAALESAVPATSSTVCPSCCTMPPCCPTRVTPSVEAGARAMPVKVGWRKLTITATSPATRTAPGTMTLQAPERMLRRSAPSSSGPALLANSGSASDETSS
mmetsp:Transcript_66220/g.191130  ORF Transcript_66220/g.191130 Transcript_66220/m.191130 type:complete len:207 (-) Transcript_66220:189-809(-)